MPIQIEINLSVKNYLKQFRLDSPQLYLDEMIGNKKHPVGNLVTCIRNLFAALDLDVPNQKHIHYEVYKCMVYRFLIIRSS